MSVERREECWEPVGRNGAGPAVDEAEIGAPSRWVDSRIVDVSPDLDLFGSEVPRESIDRVFAVMMGAPHHEYLLLTTCAKRLLVLANDGLVLPRSLWLGVTVEGDEQVWRVEDLLRCNTSRAWVSLRLRGPVPSLPIEMLAWVVCTSGDSDEPGLVEAVRDRCVAARVPFRYLAISPGGVPTLGDLDGRVWNGVPWETAGQPG